jgi:hypothetical protein
MNAAHNLTPLFFTSDVFLVFLMRAISLSYLMVLDVLHLPSSALQQTLLTCKVLMSERLLATSLHAPPVTHNSICLQRAAEVLPPAEWTCVMSFGCVTNDQRPNNMQLKLCCSSQQPRGTQCLEWLSFLICNPRCRCLRFSKVSCVYFLHVRKSWEEDDLLVEIDSRMHDICEGQRMKINKYF